MLIKHFHISLFNIIVYHIQQINVWSTRYSRKGNTNIDKILTEVSKWARAWKNAQLEKIDEQRPHCENAFKIYKKWFLSNTRAYLVSKEEGDPIGSNMYPMHRDRSRRACVRLFILVTICKAFHNSHFNKLTYSCFGRLMFSRRSYHTWTITRISPKSP
jgi:hypothetical protein